MRQVPHLDDCCGQLAMSPGAVWAAQLDAELTPPSSRGPAAMAPSIAATSSRIPWNATRRPAVSNHPESRSSGSRSTSRTSLTGPLPDGHRSSPSRPPGGPDTPRSSVHPQLHPPLGECLTGTVISRGVTASSSARTHHTSLGQITRRRRPRGVDPPPSVSSDQPPTRLEGRVPRRSRDRVVRPLDLHQQGWTNKEDHETQVHR